MNLDNFSYHLPTKIFYGINISKNVEKFINKRKTILITSNGFVKRGVIDNLFTDKTFIVDIIYNVKSHPDLLNMEKIYEMAHKNDFELILAIGGGSVIDSAKFISIFNKKKEFKFIKNITINNDHSLNYSQIPIIAIPTTSGTSSEITPYSTIWDFDNKKKYSLSNSNLYCEKAIYDPNLTLTLPKNITIHSGLDSLSHAFDSIWNKNANRITVTLAIKAIKIILDYLVKLSNDLDNLDYRDKLMQASIFAGMAFSQTQTSIAHGMSYYITTHKFIEHGIACSFTLPDLIDKVIGKYDFIDQALYEIFGELSSTKIRLFFRDLGISTDFQSYGIYQKELDELKSSIENNERAFNSLVSLF